MKTNQTLTTGEIARHCGVSFRTVIRWIERGELSAFKLPGRGDNRVRVDVFLEFLRQHDMPIPEDLADSQNRVLVIEDDPDSDEGVRHVLERNGFEVEVAGDGFRAGTLLGTFTPSVLTLDLDLDGLSVQDVFNFLRTTVGLESIKVLIISSDEEIDPEVAAAADEILLKPFNPELLVERVSELAGRRPVLEALAEPAIA